MRNAARTCLLGLSLLLLTAAAPAQAQPVPTRASLEACQAGAAPLERVAEFGAQMGALPGTKRMQVRFDLQERVPGARFRAIQAPGLGVWRTSAAGVDIFRYRKQVANLDAPAHYRAVVRFRWLAGRKVVRQATRRTAICKQPDARADLALGAVTAEHTGERNMARYVLAVRNDGRSASGPFTVGLSVGDDPRPAQTVEGLEPGAQRTLTFAGPRCDAGRPLRVSLDADLIVDESDEADNLRSIACPLSS